MALTSGRVPWFSTVSLSDVFKVQMTGKNRVRWDVFDVDSLSIIASSNDYSIIAK